MDHPQATYSEAALARESTQYERLATIVTDETNILGETLGLLELKINPVMAPDLPQPSSTPERALPDEPDWLIGAQLYVMASEIKKQRMRLQDLIDRVRV